jgi:RNA polymerase sigma-70 factor, ECF subfamily
MAEASRLRALPGGRAQEAPPPSDEDIVSAIASGQEWAADKLYDLLHPTVERTLRRILQAPDADYDDLMQSTFERIVRTLTSRRFAGACSLATWASAIAGHVALDALRTRIRTRRIFTADAAGLGSVDCQEPVSPERRLEARAEIENLQRVLSDMKPEQAQTLVLHDVLGHELSEIAVMTGVTVAAAQSRLVRGRKELLRRVRVDARGAR